MLWSKTIKKILPLAKPHKGRVAIAVFFSLIIAALGGAQVRLVKPIFDQGLNPNASREEILTLVGMLFLIGLIHFPVRYFHFYIMRFVCEKIVYQLRSDLFQKFQILPLKYFSSSKQGEMISNVMNDTTVYAHGFRSIIDLIREPLKAAVFLGMAFWNDWQLSLVIFGIAPFLILIFAITGKKVKSYQHAVQEKLGKLTHNVSEGLAAQKLSKAFNLQNFVNSRFSHSQDEFFDNQMKSSRVEELAHPLVEIVGTVAFCGVLLFAHHRIQSGELSVGAFISFIAALALFMDPVRKFSQANIRLSQSAGAGQRIEKLLALAEEKHDGKKMEQKFKDVINIKNLSFAYDEANVLEDFSIEIKKGEKVALVGLSGSGKTTIINLLLGLYPLETGSIEIDGKNINDIHLHSLRSLFGLVSQDIFLFNDSIKNNLLLGKDFSDAEVKQALKVAYAEDFIDQLPQGIETEVGDRGVKLSGGQQQRITIARAFLHDAPILLFDEATSSLDNESEQTVQKALDSIAGNKTVIAVAHRLSTIQNYDKIFVMKQGRILEYGNHQNLIAKAGEYAKLYALSSSN